MAHESTPDTGNGKPKQSKRRLEWGMTAGERRAIIGLVILILLTSGYRYLQKRNLSRELQIITSSESAAPNNITEATSLSAGQPLFAAGETSSLTQHPININEADAKLLETLPGIGPVKARAIIEYRTQHGPFKRVEDLIKVKGIGPKTLEKIRPLVTVSPSSSPQGKGSPRAGEEQRTPTSPPERVKVQLRSSAFRPGEYIPDRYTCRGQDLSPALSWERIEGVSRWALICEDPDAPRGIFTHWIIYDLPDTMRTLWEGFPDQPEFSWGGRQGRNDFGSIGYRGPCPPPGKPHRYFFILYALSRPTGLSAGVSRDQFLKAIKPYILASDTIMGLYRR